MLQPPCRLLHDGLYQLDPMEVFIGSTKQYYCMRCISHKSSCIVNGPIYNNNNNNNNNNNLYSAIQLLFHRALQ